jgi:hypothetical protein
VDIFERPRDDSSQGVRWTARMRQNSGVRAPRNVG